MHSQLIRTHLMFNAQLCGANSGPEILLWVELPSTMNMQRKQNGSYCLLRLEALLHHSWSGQCDCTWCRDVWSWGPWTRSGWVCQRRRRSRVPAWSAGSAGGNDSREYSEEDSHLQPSRSYPSATAPEHRQETDGRYFSIVIYYYSIYSV